MFQKSISNEEINELPLTAFEGNITLVDTISSLQEVAAELSGQSILGFDTETRPSFKKGKRNPVCLLQFATPEKAFLIRLNRVGLQPEIISVMSNPNIIKVGVALREDIRSLQELAQFTPAGFIDLQDYVKKFDIVNYGLKKLSAIVLNVRISKNQRLTNWELDELSDSQLRYAATDAWATLQIFRKLDANTLFPFT